MNYSSDDDTSRVLFSSNFPPQSHSSAPASSSSSRRQTRLLGAIFSDAAAARSCVRASPQSSPAFCVNHLSLPRYSDSCCVIPCSDLVAACRLTLSRCVSTPACAFLSIADFCSDSCPDFIQPCPRRLISAATRQVVRVMPPPLLLPTASPPSQDLSLSQRSCIRLLPAAAQLPVAPSSARASSAAFS